MPRPSTRSSQAVQGKEPPTNATVHARPTRSRQSVRLAAQRGENANSNSPVIVRRRSGELSSPRQTRHTPGPQATPNRFCIPHGNACGKALFDNPETSQHALIHSHESNAKRPKRLRSQNRVYDSKDLLELMKNHDRANRRRPICSRSFYVPWWYRLLVSWDPADPHSEDDDAEGEITFVRFVNLTPLEIEVSKRYIRFLEGEEVPGPKMMIRLRCALIHAGGKGEEVSAWPPKTRLLFNSHELRIPHDLPLYISFVDFKEINTLSVTVVLDELGDAYFKLYLEFFSVSGYGELERLLEEKSPHATGAKEILGKAVRYAKKGKSGYWKTPIPLACPVHRKPHLQMKKPVYGRTCNHLERLDLDCFLDNIDVSATFEWKCPFCKADSSLYWPPLYSDKLVRGIIEANEDNPAEYVHLNSDGVIWRLDPGRPTRV